MLNTTLIVKSYIISDINSEEFVVQIYFATLHHTISISNLLGIEGPIFYCNILSRMRLAMVVHIFPHIPPHSDLAYNDIMHNVLQLRAYRVLNPIVLDFELLDYIQNNRFNPTYIHQLISGFRPKL